MSGADVLELLLPEADPRAMERARRVVTCLRLVRDDATGRRAETVGIDLTRAREHLEGEERARLVHALESLLGVHLAEALGAESFLVATLERTRADHEREWRALLDARERLPRLPGLPRPGEAALEVAERLFSALAALARDEEGDEDVRDPIALAVWRACLARARAGAREGERAFRQSLRRAEAARRSAPVDARFALELRAGLVACLLDRGAVLEARSFLADERETGAERADPALAAAAARLARLAAWTHLACGDAQEARRRATGAPAEPATLPATLSELRERRPEWLPLLAGRVPRAVESVRELPSFAELRGELGAAVIACFRFDARRGASAIEIELAPALREGARAWLEARSAAAFSPHEPEHRVVIEARPWIEHADDPARPRGALSPRARARVLWPLVEPEGRVAGWLDLELEHHLVPSRGRLAALAGRALELARSVGGATSAPGEDPRASGAPDEPARLLELDEAEPEARRAFERFVGALPFKVGQRLWWGFLTPSDTTDGRARTDPPSVAPLVARGGRGGGFTGEVRGRGWALARAIAAGGGLAWSEPEPGLALHAGAGSGVVVPLRRAGRGRFGCVEGWLVVESSRRRDLGPADLERFEVEGRSFALELALARFSTWHRARRGAAIALDAREPGFATLLPTLLAIADVRAPTWLIGPPGAGKLVLARFLHRSAARGAGPCVEIDARRPDERERLAVRIGEARGGTLVVRYVDELPDDAQRFLLAWLEEPSDETCARLIATSRESAPAEPGDGAALREDLALRLAALRVRVPGLAERRSAIAPLFRFLATRAAEREDLEAPSVDDDALALLWRQAWRGNVRELEALATRLAVLRPGETLDAGCIAEASLGLGCAPRERLPSRHPPRAEVVAALRESATLGGRVNKTRAAQLLGWDPDTLVARLADLGIAGERVEELPALDGWSASCTPPAEQEPLEGV